MWQMNCKIFNNSQLYPVVAAGKCLVVNAAADTEFDTVVRQLVTAAPDALTAFGDDVPTTADTVPFARVDGVATVQLVTFVTFNDDACAMADGMSIVRDSLPKINRNRFICGGFSHRLLFNLLKLQLLVNALLLLQLLVFRLVGGCFNEPFFVVLVFFKLSYSEEELSKR